MSSAIAPRLLGALLLGTLVERWHLLAIVADPAPGATTARFVAAIWVLLVLLSGVGLLMRRGWAPYLLVLTAVVSTIFHGISLIPGAVGLLPNAQRPVGVLVANTLVAIAGLVLALMRRRPPAPESR